MYISTYVKKLSRLIEKRAIFLLKETSITHGYTNFLIPLYQEDGITQTALQRIAGVEHPTVVRALDRMARDGLIERRANPKDRRSFLIFLTKKARAQEETVEKAAIKLNHDLLKNFSKQEILSFEAYLKRLCDNLDANK